MSRRKTQDQKTKRQLETRLAEVKAILAQADATNGVSLYDLNDWNDYHDEQYALEQALNKLDMDWEFRVFTPEQD